jgi:hypothetical protein
MKFDMKIIPLDVPTPLLHHSLPPFTYRQGVSTVDVKLYMVQELDHSFLEGSIHCPYSETQ